MAKLAHGMADNMVSLTAVSLRAPLMLAPAMDGGMYSHPATQANVNTLIERGAVIIGPAEGRMASGLIGKGRMVEPAAILGAIRQQLGRQLGNLSGRHVVVTAGPTREKIDPVRFITNRSTGKQGLALAQAALDAGANVTLIVGPIAAELPQGAAVVPVDSTQEMHDATISACKTADVLLMVAAVSDFRPATAAEQKLKKTQAEAWGMAISLERTLDILEGVKQQREQVGSPKVVVGFAAETQNAFEYGRGKLIRKGLDLIAINDVTAAGAGFGVDTNRVLLINRKEEVTDLPLMSKTAVAEQIISMTAGILAVKENTV